MVSFLEKVHQEVNVLHSLGSAGSPWEFNLRDLLRWCNLIESAQSYNIEDSANHFISMLFLQRFRANSDHVKLIDLMRENGFDINEKAKVEMSIQPTETKFGWAKLPRQIEGKSSFSNDTL